MSEESEKATVIVVTEASGRERRFDADAWEHGDKGGIDIMRNSREEDPVVAVYAPGAWLSVREEGAAANDGPADKRKLGMALTGLAQIGDHVEDAENRDWADLRLMVDDILSQVEDVDL